MNDHFLTLAKNLNLHNYARFKPRRCDIWEGAAHIMHDGINYLEYVKESAYRLCGIFKNDDNSLYVLNPCKYKDELDEFISMREAQVRSWDELITLLASSSVDSVKDVIYYILDDILFFSTIPVAAANRFIILIDGLISMYALDLKEVKSLKLVISSQEVLKRVIKTQRKLT